VSEEKKPTAEDVAAWQVNRLAQKLRDTGATAEEIRLVAQHLPELAHARAVDKARAEQEALDKAQRDLAKRLRDPRRIG
jgi:hypothetical protein